MKLVYDAEADAAYLYIGAGKAKVAKTVAATEAINLDFDAEGRLLGVEITGASRVLPKTALKERV